MDEEFETFLRERKARVAEDKAHLEQDPPYMEIRGKAPWSYESTVKENIPPDCLSHKKESSVGLPFGVEYERKKKRLQHELRMDYRSYMAQALASEDQVQRQRPTLHRDAATLTDMAVRVLPEESEEPSSVLHHHDRLERQRDLESGKEEFMRVAQERGERSRQRNVGVGTSRYGTPYNNSDDRDKRWTSLELRKERRPEVQLKDVRQEFATGLIIGVADTFEMLQKRKECYRRELQEQIAEQERNRKREKDLELKVAATGVNDPEKKPDRIRQFGLHGRKNLQVSESVAQTETEPYLLKLGENRATDARGMQTPPPDQPHVAFQSPVLECSSSLGLMAGGLSPTGRLAAIPISRSMDAPRVLHTSATNDVYRSLYAEPNHHYGNLLEPNMVYYIPPGGPIPCPITNHIPQSQNDRSCYPEQSTQQSKEASVADHHVRPLPAEGAMSSKERVFSYRDALKLQKAPRRDDMKFLHQIQEQQERKRLEREAKERYEAQLEADMKNHQPWGRGGGGAPLRDSTGNLITDLKQMHKQNEEAYINPEQRRVPPPTYAPERFEPKERVSGFTHVQTPQFARGNVFSSKPTQQQLQEQDKYKAELKQQIEEKMRKKAEEREQIRLEEEKEEKRLMEQRARIQREFEEEQEKKKQKEMEQKAKNEELIQMAEQRKREAERKKEAERREAVERRKEAEEREKAELRRQYEKARQVQEVCRQPSPPIPTLQKKRCHHQSASRPPSVQSRHSTAPLSERSLSGLQSPPVPACRNKLRAAGEQRDVLSELSVLRRQLFNEQKRLQKQIQQEDLEDFNSQSHRHHGRPLLDVFDLARLRRQAPVRRPNSRNLEPRNLSRIHDSLQLNYPDSRYGSSDAPGLDNLGMASPRRRDYRDLYHQPSSQRSTVQDDYLDLSPLHINYQRSGVGAPAEGSLLESDSAFIDPLGNAFPVLPMPELKRHCQLSARERRRLNKQAQAFQDAAGQRDDDSPDHTNCKSRQEAAALDFSDDDDTSSPQFSPFMSNHRSSVETASTDAWLRPGTSESIKCLDRQLRRQQVTT
ncbi:centrosome and spindle pole associated protein 1-like isoform 1-T1 [Synchiropus picturatus]